MEDERLNIDLALLIYYDALLKDWVETTFGGNPVKQVLVDSGLTDTGADQQHPKISLNLKNATFLSGLTAVTASTADRTYAVGLDSNGKLAVNVPWTGGGSSGDSRIPLVEIAPSNAITIDPNKVYKVTSALSGNTTITFNTSAEESGYCNEYAIIFTVSDSITITFPNGIKYNGGNVPTYVVDRTYEAHICNGLAVIGEFY